MAIAPQNIMATLRSMPDEQLVKYAAMHKNDPFIFPLAFQESQSRKRMRSSQQAQGAADMPKVADQAMAAMTTQTQLPEDVGIAQLPADNMQGMAGGGIVAFDDGGEVTGSTYAEQMAKLGDFLDPIRRFRQLVGDPVLREQEAAEMKKLSSTTKTVPTPTATPYAVTSTAPTGNIMGSRRTPVELAKEAASKVGTSRQDDEGISKLLPAAPGAGKAVAAQAAAPAGLGSIAEFAKEANEYTGVDPTAKQLERIEKQEARAGSDKSEALNMALIKAGLGMMSGTSRHAFENIGKGAMGGLEDYAAAMKDLKKAALERDKMRDAAEQAAYAYKRDDVKGYRTAKENEANRRTEMEKAQLAASTQLQSAGITAGAHLRAAQLPPKEAQMAALLGEGKTFEERFQSGLPKLTAIQAGKFDPRKAYTDYLVAAQRSGTGDIMSFPEFAMQFAPRVSGGGAGTVLERRD